MGPKYQIFVSSTYGDLQAEREQVIKAILEMGHIPVGMEMFSAADEEQWKLITRQIDESDYYVVVIAHRYGSVIAEVSYTEKEYDFAVQRGVPVLGFIIDNNASWPADRMEADPMKKAALDTFKEKARKKPVGFWSNAEELYGKFAIALMKLIITNPRPGWVRSSELAGAEVMNELSRLSSENAKLRQEVEFARSKVEEDIHAQRRKLVRTLRSNKIRVRFWYAGAKSWSEGKDISLFRIFELIAPEIVIERHTNDLSGFIARMLRGSSKPPLRSEWPIPSNSLKTWLADLMTLGLIEPSRKKHPVSDTNEYWSLTVEGREVYKSLRRVLLEEEPEAAQEQSEEQALEADADNIGQSGVG